MNEPVQDEQNVTGTTETQGTPQESPTTAVGYREYIDQISGEYPAEVRDQVRTHLEGLRDRVAGTLGNQNDTLAREAGTLKETNNLLEQNLQRLQSQVDSIVQLGTAQQDVARKAQLAQKFGMTPDEVDILSANLREMGFVSKDELPDIQSTVQTVESQQKERVLQSELDNWQQQFGEVFAPYRPFLEKTARRLNYDLTEVQPDLVNLAKSLQEQSLRHQKQQEERGLERDMSTTTVPTSPTLADLSDHAVYAPDGSLDLHATFRNIPEDE